MFVKRLLHVNNSDTVGCSTLNTLASSLVDYNTIVLEILSDLISTSLRQLVVDLFATLWRSSTNDLNMLAALHSVEKGSQLSPPEEPEPLSQPP